ncbi:MAG: hypothetical protein ABI693_00500 [Bryobacteraceae bacterium]
MPVRIFRDGSLTPMACSSLVYQTVYSVLLFWISISAARRQASRRTTCCCARRNLAQAMEVIQVCAATAKAQFASVGEFLGRY